MILDILIFVLLLVELITDTNSRRKITIVGAFVLVLVELVLILTNHGRIDGVWL